MASPLHLLPQQVRAGRARAQLPPQQLLEAQENECRRLARELHDEIGLALSAVKINLQALQRAPDDSAGRLCDSIAIVDRALQQVRNLSLELRPSLLDDLGALDLLTSRQREILQLVAEGHGTKQIARLLAISVKTVETHRAQLMDRLDIHDVPGLVRLAIRSGLVAADR